MNGPRIVDDINKGIAKATRVAFVKAVLQGEIGGSGGSPVGGKILIDGDWPDLERAASRGPREAEADLPK